MINLPYHTYKCPTSISQILLRVPQAQCNSTPLATEGFGKYSITALLCLTVRKTKQAGIAKL